MPAIAFDPRAASGERAPVGDLRELAALLVSPVTGILRRMILSPRASDEIGILSQAAELADFGKLPGMGPIDPTGGSGFNTSESLARILFETVERYCGAFVDYSRMVRSKPVSSDFLFGSRYPLYADEQYAQPQWPFRRLTEESEIWWSEGRSLITGRPAFVPSVFVHVPYRPADRQEWLGPSVSTGMAAAWSWEEACLSGLLEVCERDAFSIMWMNRISMPRITVHPDSCFGRHLARTLGGSARVHFVNLTNDLGIPTVLAVLKYAYLGKPLVTVGASAKLDPEQACRKAFAEAADGYTRVVSQLEQMGGRWHPAADFSNIVDWTWHGLAYNDAGLQKAMEFVTASPEEQPFEKMTRAGAAQDAAGELKWAVSSLRRVFPEMVILDLTTREFAELGIHAVKAIIPEAVPLHPDHRYPWLGHKRLYQVPYRLGFAPSETTIEMLNPNPHPFA